MHPQVSFPRTVVYEFDSCTVCVWDHYDDGWYIKNAGGSFWDGVRFCWFNRKRFHRADTAWNEFKEKIRMESGPIDISPNADANTKPYCNRCGHLMGVGEKTCGCDRFI